MKMQAPDIRVTQKDRAGEKNVERKEWCVRCKRKERKKISEEYGKNGIPKGK
jgi:hypothetical protein